MINVSRNINKIVFFVTILLVVTGCQKKPALSSDNEINRWVLVYRNDASGNTVLGNKQELIEAVRKGFPVRIGFGIRRASDSTKSVEHVTNASFLTISNGEEVFAQIAPIIGQNPELESDSLNITFRQNIEWSMIVGTNGFSDRLSTDKLADTIISHRTRPTEVSWFVNFVQSENIAESPSLPLYAEE